MNHFDQLTSMITKLILDNTRYNVPRLGQISKIDDPLQKGRVLVHIPSLGWDTDDTGAWCYPKDKNALVTPNVNTYVIVEFIDGNRDLPVYSGVATNMKDMLPDNYDGLNTTQVIAESKNGSTAIIIKELLGELILKTGDASGWMPCIIPNCIFSGALHGGAVAGIVKLKGE